MAKYNPKIIERKWQEKWRKGKLYETKDSVKGKGNYMLLTEFPYPSGNLHIGHWYAFAVPDILARFLRLNGKNLMYPMGFDAFGLPAENAAIKHGLDPRKWTEQNIAYMTEQFATMGGSFDWSRKVSTIDPEYYKWTQWIFLKMFEKGLAGKSETTVNWCPKDKTVLANEQVVDNCCERCDTPVEQRKLEQWMLKITDYADRLIDDIEKMDWPESTKLAQKNWIGISEGAKIKFPLVIASEAKQSRQQLEVFTTRLDTIFGCTYCVVAPENELISKLESQISNYREVEKYIAKAKKKTELQRTELAKEKTGVELEGIRVINPFTNESVPIFVADYVLGHYGTGAVMAVPAHDERDFEFAKKYKLPVKEVIEPNFIKNDGPDKVRFEEPFVKRDAIMAIVKHWKENSYLGLKWKQADWKTFVTGGPEKSQSMEEAARSEIIEETGYKNLKLIKELPKVHSQFYHIPKKLNRFAHFRVFYFELKNGERQDISRIDQKRHEVVWVPKKEVENFLTPDSHKYIWELLNGKKEAYTDDGVLTNSAKYSGLTSEKAREEMMKWLEKNGLGKRTKTYRLHDWVISRQRYWGVPIPVVYCEKCGTVPVPEKDLPVKLPELKDFHPTGDGKSPLAKAEKWVSVKCPQCKGKAKRETDTMDTFVDSSWYFIRYADPKNKKKFADKEKMKKWLPVPMYIGGAEHNTMHLLYSRFFTKVLYDLGHINFSEPFTSRRNHGIIIAPDNQKMSKSRGNVIDPDAEVKKWGADSVRMYLAFMGPYDQNASWQMTGIVGVRRFLEKIWSFFERHKKEGEEYISEWVREYEKGRKYKLKGEEHAMGDTSPEVKNLLHKTIKKVGEDIENLRLNTAISQMMIFLNSFYKVYDYDYKKGGAQTTMSMEGFLRGSDFKKFLIVLSPFAPHISEEIWAELGHKTSIFKEKWPKYDPKLVREDEITLIIQVNGKVRDQITISADASEQEVKEKAFDSEKIQKYIQNIDNVRKIIFVPGRLINFVV